MAGEGENPQGKQPQDLEGFNMDAFLDQVTDHAQNTPVEAMGNRLLPQAFPKRFDHFANPHVESPVFDQAVGQKINVFHKEAPLSVLNALLVAEAEDVQAQQQAYEAAHPEWGRQKVIVRAAKDALDDKYAQDTVTVTAEIRDARDPNPYEIGVAEHVIGNHRGRTFSRETIGQEYDEAMKFETQLGKLQKLQAYISRMAQGFPLDGKGDEAEIERAKNELMDYLSTKIDRYTPTESAAGNPKTRERNFFVDVSKQVDGYGDIRAIVRSSGLPSIDMDAAMLSPDSEPQEATIRELELAAANLVKDSGEKVVSGSEMLIGETGYLSGDSIIRVRRLVIVHPMTQSQSTETVIQTRDRFPVVGPDGERNYPRKTIRITNAAGRIEVQTQEGLTTNRNTDNERTRLSNTMHEVSGERDLPILSSDESLREQIEILGSLTDADQLDRWGLTEAEKAAEASDIQAIEAEVGRLAIIVGGTEIQEPVFVGPQGKRVTISLYQKAPDGKRKNLVRGKQPRTGLMKLMPRRDPQDIHDLVDKGAEIEDFGVNVVTVTSSSSGMETRNEVNYLTTAKPKSAEARGMRLVASEKSEYYRDGRKEETHLDPNARLTLEEMEFGEDILDRTQIPQVRVSPNGRLELLQLLKSLGRENLKASQE